MNIICLDTEFTGTVGHNEILELSIYDGTGKETFHHLYKPEYCRSWACTEKIHGITPEMVENEPHFSEHIPELQKLFDTADLLVGFAIENDVKMLSRAGIKRLEEERCLDVRHLYWACRGEAEGVDLFAIPNLVTCAGACGFDWESAKAHSASADAMATLLTYNVLLKEFADKFSVNFNGAFLDDDHVKKIIRKLRKRVDEAIYRRDKELAEGYIYLFEQGGLYNMVVRHQEFSKETILKKEFKGQKLIGTIQVADRWQACYDIVKKFQRRWVKGVKLSSHWKLKEKEVEYFKNYTNEYRGDSKLYKHMLEYGKIW